MSTFIIFPDKNEESLDEENTFSTSLIKIAKLLGIHPFAQDKCIKIDVIVLKIANIYDYIELV